MSQQSELTLDRAIARDLPRAWPAFFQRFGRLTPVQRAVIPQALAGQDLLVCSATASGKTEAACAPLVERFIDSGYPWLILYVSPTRALVNDLYERLQRPLGELGLAVRRRTGEYKDLWPPNTRVVLTTPESFDSMLCRGRTPEGHLLAPAVAVVLDEIHLVHGTPRGEQLRFLLQRLRQLRSFAVGKGWTQNDSFQVLALSATVPDPEDVRDAFLPNGEVLSVSGSREIVSVGDSGTAPIVESALPDYIASLEKAEKILVFCNSRRRVDDLTSESRRDLETLGYAVAAHHGSLSKNVREDAETLLHNGERVAVFATSTLEIGIDIGDVDLVVLDGPPPDIPSLLQRIGRGNRRTGATRVMACGTSAADAVVHGAMLESARQGSLGYLERGPQLAVTRQQIASYIFQGPSRSRQRRTLVEFLSSAGANAHGPSILDHMLATDELIQDAAGIRLGEDWAEATSRGGIHSNIEGGLGSTIIDHESGTPIAKDVEFRGGPGMKVGGNLLNVRRWTDWKIEVSRVAKREMAEGQWRYSSRPWMKGAGQPQAVRWYLGLQEDEWPVLSDGETAIVFHFGGGRRQAVLDLMRRSAAPSETGIVVNPWFLSFPGRSGERPHWIDSAGVGALRLQVFEHLDRLERTLGRPTANRRLPTDVRVAEVEGWLALEPELDAIAAARWKAPEDDATEDVLRLFVEVMTKPVAF